MNFNMQPETNEILQKRTQETSRVLIKPINQSLVYFQNQNGEDLEWFATFSSERNPGDQWEVYRPNKTATANVNSHSFWKSFDNPIYASMNVEWAILAEM